MSKFKCVKCGELKYSIFKEDICGNCYDKEKQELIDDFIKDMKEKDNKINCKYRCGGKPGEPCEQCTNYKYCPDNNYPIIKKWEAKKLE